MRGSTSSTRKRCGDSIGFPRAYPNTCSLMRSSAILPSSLSCLPLLPTQVALERLQPWIAPGLDAIHLVLLLVTWARVIGSLRHALATLLLAGLAYVNHTRSGARIRNAGAQGFGLSLLMTLVALTAHRADEAVYFVIFVLPLSQCYSSAINSRHNSS